MTSEASADYCKCYGVCQTVKNIKLTNYENGVLLNETRVDYDPSEERIRPVCEYVKQGDKRPDVDEHGCLDIEYSFRAFRSYKKNKEECAGFNLNEVVKPSDRAATRRKVENIFGAPCRKAWEEFYTSKSERNKKGSERNKKGRMISKAH